MDIVAGLRAMGGVHLTRVTIATIQREASPPVGGRRIFRRHGNYRLFDYFPWFLYQTPDHGAQFRYHLGKPAEPTRAFHAWQEAITQGGEGIFIRLFHRPGHWFPLLAFISPRGRVFQLSHHCLDGLFELPSAQKSMI